jgi:hypothetical protein
VRLIGYFSFQFGMTCFGRVDGSFVLNQSAAQQIVEPTCALSKALVLDLAVALRQQTVAVRLLRYELMASSGSRNVIFLAEASEERIPTLDAVGNKRTIQMSLISEPVKMSETAEAKNEPFAGIDLSLPFLVPPRFTRQRTRHSH